MDPLQDGMSRIELLDHMGGDLAVVNDAKASFDRVADELGDREIKLLRYLAEHNHTSPFRGTVFKFRVKAPLFVCRQWWKHVIASNHNDEQLGWNETSFRYVAIDSPEYYCPESFRLQAKDNKQGSEGQLELQDDAHCRRAYRNACNAAYDAYSQLLEMGVCREEARAVLPPSFYTTWVWTASLQSVLHFVDLRKGYGAQSQIVKYAECVEELILPIVPHAISAWNDAKQ